MDGPIPDPATLDDEGDDDVVRPAPSTHEARLIANSHTSLPYSP